MYDRDLFMMQQLAGGQGQWISVALISGIFLVLAFKRESISNLGLFRLGILFLATAMVLPPLVGPLVQILRFPTSGSGFGMMLLSALNPCCNALATVCIAFSMLPVQQARKPSHPIASAPIKKHPLDD